MRIIKSHGSLEAAISAQHNSPITYGSEFRPTSILQPLMHRHPIWEKTSHILNNGTTFPLTQIDDKLRHKDLLAALEYKNHNSAHPITSSLAKHMSTEIEHGWSLPLPPNFALELKGAEIAPHGMVKQNTITELGEIVEKERVTHDQSYPGQYSKESINSRVIDEELADCLFGYMNNRVIHYIIGCRQRHPTTRIWVSKIDWKSAYRRQHFSHNTAVKSLTQVCIQGIWFLLMALRLTFGGKPCPSEWGCISELVADLATDILNCEEWDPTTTKSPIQDKFPPRTSLPDDIPFAKARHTIVDIPQEDKGKCDVYIDDTVAMGPDLPGNALRLESAITLAFHIFGRPIDKNEPIPRKDIIAFNKLIAEGAIEEQKILLGWLYDTRRLLISLPLDKWQNWSKDLLDLIENKQTSFHDLDTLIGRLNHVGYIIPTARHFLSRIRNLKYKAKFKRQVIIPGLVIKDLILWLSFLESAKNGISMNILSYRSPTHLYRSDSCKHGLGGYTAQGLAWRWIIPDRLLSRAHINLLEFLASIICIWLDILEGHVLPESCLLSMGDSTTAAGWLRKSNFKEDDENDVETTVKLVAARHLATLILQAKACLYSQWFAGDENDISDSLSRDIHLSTPILTNLLKFSFPSQIPTNFRFVQLPCKIVSWVSSLLERLPVNPQRHVKHKTRW